MSDLPQFLAEATPWGLTVGQTASIFVVAAVLLLGWVIVHVGLRLTATLFRLGCAALMVFMCGLVSFFLIYNFASRN
jgi:hypothetical protein